MIAACMIAIPQIGLADAAVGDVIVTLGENLTPQQKETVLQDLNAPENAQTVTVSNEEEHKYLGQYIPKSQIGTKALSSSSITIEKSGSGLEVQTKNITAITDEMYLNALMTAGVKDATVQVTAPFEVSGTAALTGLIKAYEVSSDQVIPEDVKQVANEELVTTSELGQKHGEENAAALMAKVKEQVAQNGVPANDEELRTMIENAAKELGITLTEEEINSLISLFNKMKDANIDWNQVSQQLDQAKEKITKFIESEEGQNFIDQVIQFFAAIWNAIVSLFNGGGQNAAGLK
ncbi:DUF1002 domain-containing protein [Bacillus mangrovi]|uniref:DUF1002 domain-containing protein n=2 Tax=Metabacillus mangrovi TaxID=1491830 RepID=A0A7X2S2V2_9BACI|nr:DUF1002 domain-containing protein [Metabacillus mangrovi]MTH52240.1 DUF1002 domain-containing protein [Metabacillus mangrovi]